MTESAAAHKPTHDEIVERLDRVIRDIDGAREHCHRRLHEALEAVAPQHLIATVDGVVHAYTCRVEGHFNDLIELKLMHPSAWDASEGGRRQYQFQSELNRLVVDSMALVLGFGWPETEGPLESAAPPI